MLFTFQDRNKERWLKSKARHSTKLRGHRMEKSWKRLDAQGWEQSLKCIECGMESIIDLQPLPNGVDISGEAIALNCPVRW